MEVDLDGVKNDADVKVIDILDDKDRSLPTMARD